VWLLDGDRDLVRRVERRRHAVTDLEAEGMFAGLQLDAGLHAAVAEVEAIVVAWDDLAAPTSHGGARG
jgi:hypothetical protein